MNNPVFQNQAEFEEENEIAYMEITGGHEEFNEDFNYTTGRPFQDVEAETGQINAHDPEDHKPPVPPF